MVLNFVARRISRTLPRILRLLSTPRPYGSLKNHEHRGEGFAILESLVSITLFALLGLAFANSMIVGYRMRQHMIHRTVALQVASDEMERQTRLRANTLTAGTTTSTVVKYKMSFRQVVTITAAAANGFDVSVVVTDLSNRIGGSIRLQNKLVPYGST